MNKFLPLFLIVFTSVIIYSQDNSGWKFSAQIQARSELDGRDFSNKSHPLTFTSLRTRLGIENTVLDKVNLMVQIQDSRIFGEEPNTLSSIDNVDIHQAYFKINNLLGSAFSVQAGRFEMKYGTERFIGPVGWHYIGRAFDGIRFTYNDLINVDLFGVTLVDEQPYISNAVSTVYPFPQSGNTSFSMYGFWNSNSINQFNTLDFFAYYEIDRRSQTGEPEDMKRVTTGLTYLGKLKPVEIVSEGAIQAGKIGNQDIFAYLFSLQGYFDLTPFRLGVGADILSGSDPGDDKYGSFNPSFGTNHKFYGYMDYFINIPVNTGRLGLYDFYISADWNKKDNPFSGSISIHQFNSNKALKVAYLTEELSNFGQEIDLTLRYMVVKGSVLTWGGSVFLPGRLMKEFFRTPGSIRSNPGFWSYIMATITL